MNLQSIQEMCAILEKENSTLNENFPSIQENEQTFSKPKKYNDLLSKMISYHRYLSMYFV